MPIMDGVDATRQIRGSVNQYKDIPIIALTANAMKEDMDHYKQVGMNDYVSKPIDSTLLAKTLSTYLKTTP